MRIRFYLRKPGKHEEVATLEFDAVPRIGDSVVLEKDGESRVVHDVTWKFSEDDVVVLLKD